MKAFDKLLPGDKVYKVNKVGSKITLETSEIFNVFEHNVSVKSPTFSNIPRIAKSIKEYDEVIYFTSKIEAEANHILYRNKNFEKRCANLSSNFNKELKSLYELISDEKEGDIFEVLLTSLLDSIGYYRKL